jgi:anti-sigma regulatory factor (Ser/Thr protein kinase)
MLVICGRAQRYWKSGIDINLALPVDDKLRALFINTNWAYLIDFISFDESRYRGYTHAPAIRFANAKEQYQATNKILDILLAALAHFRREDLRAIEWAINEITDNVINHAQSDVGGFIQITNLRQRSQIEFVVCDCGIGIPATLRGTHKHLRTDQEALDAAIREGVTRDKQIGQGNGLYGTWRITQKSGGLFHLNSGYAELTSNQTDGMAIRNHEIPMNGSIVVSRIGYSEKFDLSDALTFSGRQHIPTDYIETHFEEDGQGNVTFGLKSESDGFGARSAGEPVRRKLTNVLNCISGGKTIVDLVDIPLVSSSYADEVFGKLFVELGPIEFSRRLEFKNVDPLVRNLIDRAILQRMKQ